MFEPSTIPSLHFSECAQVLLLAKTFDEHNWYVGFQLDPDSMEYQRQQFGRWSLNIFLHCIYDTQSHYIEVA